MMRNKTLIEVLTELEGKYVCVDGVRGLVPYQPLRIDEVVGDKVRWLQNICNIADDRTYVAQGEMYLSHIFRIRNVDTNEVIWTIDEDENVWKLRAQLMKPFLNVEFDYLVDTRVIRIKGYVDEIKVIDGKECIHVERIHDGIILSKRWLELNKVSNLKLGGYGC